MTLIYPQKYSTSSGRSQQAGNSDYEVHENEITEVETVRNQPKIEKQRFLNNVRHITSCCWYSQ